MWTNGSRSASGTPAKARRTGKPSPSKPAGASVTDLTGRMVERSAGAVRRGRTRLSGTVTAGMAISLSFDFAGCVRKAAPADSYGTRRDDVLFHRPSGQD